MPSTWAPNDWGSGDPVLHTYLNNIGNSIRTIGYGSTPGTVTVNGNGNTIGGLGNLSVTTQIAAGSGTGDTTTPLHVTRAFSPAAKIESTSNTASPALEIKDHAATPNRWWLVSGIAGATAGDFGFYDARQATPRFSVDANGRLTVNALPGSTSYANDAAAAAGGVAVGQVYRNGSVMMIRVA
jgi:hypothetical protein